jgi:hypothetical protein
MKYLAGLQKYLARLQKSQDDVVKMMGNFEYEETNKETEAKILKEVTRIYKDNNVLDDNEHTLKEAGWKIEFSGLNDRFNNISMRIKPIIDMEISFYFRDMTEKIKGGTK